MKKSFTFTQPNLRWRKKKTFRWDGKPLVEWNLWNFVAGKLNIAEWKLTKEFYELRECYSKSDARKMFYFYSSLSRSLYRLKNITNPAFVSTFFFVYLFVCSFTDHVDSHIVRIDFGHSVWHLSLLNKHRKPTGMLRKYFKLWNIAFVRCKQFYSTKTNKNNFSLWLFQLLNTRHYGGELTKL